MELHIGDIVKAEALGKGNMKAGKVFYWEIVDRETARLFTGIVGIHERIADLKVIEKLDKQTKTIKAAWAANTRHLEGTDSELTLKL